MSDEQKKQTEAISEDLSSRKRFRLWRKPYIDSAIKAGFRLLFKALYGAKATGLEHLEPLKGEPMVILPNHTSMLDGVFLAAMLPFDAAYAIDKDQYERLKKNPFLRFLFSRMDMHPLNFTDTGEMDAMTEAVKRGKPLVIFPEGMLTPTGSLGPIRSGSGQIIARARAHAVPVYLNGFNFMPFGSSRLKNHPWRFFPRLSLSVLKPRTIKIPDGVNIDKSITKSLRKTIDRQVEKFMQSMQVEAMDPNRSHMDDLYEAASNYGWRRKIVGDPTVGWMSYLQFLAGVIVMGKKLAALTKPDENVATLLPSSVAGTLTVYGLHNEGRVSAPLNPLMETGRMISCAETVQAKTVVTSRALVEKLELGGAIERLMEGGRKIVYLEDVKKTIRPWEKKVAAIQALVPFLRPRRCKNGEKLDTIPFTSGSTADPKGVCLSTANMRANGCQTAGIMGLGPSDTILSILPPFHAFGANAGMYTPLARGIPVFYCPVTNAKVVVEAYRAAQANVLCASDALAYQYARTAGPGTFKPGDKIFIGAEKMKERTRDLFIDKFGVVPYEGYGTTEASPVLAFNVAMASKKGTVGRPVPGVEIELEDVGDCSGGKAFKFRGLNRTQGYMFHEFPGKIRGPNKEETFPPDQYYNTGDVVHIDEDGYIEIRDRLSNFIKVGGEMIPADAIVKLAQTASVSEKFQHAVFPQKNSDGEEFFVLFTTDRSMRRTKLSEASQVLHAKAVGGIPVDKDIIHIDPMPLLPVGKPDVQKLKQIYRERMAASPAMNEYPSQGVQGEISPAGTPPPVPDALTM
jgi:acyl-[acyl-carrier-protein]-phospholipid O-acyltransferase/long-chain-fatty-acid--[acyl-carrier-protein] ligase